MGLPLGRAMRGVIAAVFGLLVLSAVRAHAQDGPWERLVTRDGVRLDYSPSGAWRARGRRVVEERARLRRAGRTDRLNAAVAEARITTSEAAFSGVLRFPSVLLAFRDTDTMQLSPAAKYDSVFYTAQPLAGRPYTIRTLYEEMSNGLLRVDGAAFGWYAGDSLRSFYLDACGATANAIDCGTGRIRMRQLFEAALTRLDVTVDFRQFDNDGPDGIPSSGDDDGYVDVVQFVHPEVGGECGGRGYWAHKFSMGALGREFITRDSTQGQPVLIGPYHIVAGVGGASCVDANDIMGIGTAGHELGHGLGLPDLYDTGGDTEGVGEWCLMGSANFRSLISPGHLSAWSKEQLGWVLLRELTQRGTYTLGPVVPYDTVMLVRPTGANPRGEYFLLENKQAYGSDTANMQTGRQPDPGPKVGGLLVWHIDSTKVATAGFPYANSVNAGSIHGVALVEADNFADLWKTRAAGGNRGDAGDPYPGERGNTSFSRTTQPAASKNSDGSFGGFALSGIRQDAANGPVSFKFLLGLVIRASDTLALVTVNGERQQRYHDAPDSGTALTVSIDSAQTSADGRARFVFASWSNDSARTHSVVTTGDPDSLVANVNAEYQLQVQVAGGGGVSSSPPFDDLPNGEFLPAGTAVELVATAPAGYVFDGWSGDTTAVGDTLQLTMQRPYTLTANFTPALVVAAASIPDATMGAQLTHQFAATGGTGSYLWQLVSGVLPSGVTLLTSGVLSGVPEETGTFNAVGRVRSGSQTTEMPMVLRVVAPVVSLQAVLAHLVGAGDQLTADEIRYFDILGNENRRLDVGDFAAWVEKTGVQPTAEIKAVLARRKERGR